MRWHQRPPASTSRSCSRQAAPADQATTLANAQAACIKATEDNKPFIVISWTGVFAAPQCITDDHKTLMIERHSPRTNEYLKTAQGRHILMGNTNEVAQYQAPMLDLIKSGKLKGKKVAVLYPTFTTGHRPHQGQRRRPPEVEGRERRLFRSAHARPRRRHLVAVPARSSSKLKQDGVDTLITGSAGGNTFRFSALTKELRNQGLDKDVTIYNLDARFDAVVDLSRQVGGVDGAKLINDMNIYSYSAAGQQDWRIGATEGDLVTHVQQGLRRHTRPSRRRISPNPLRPRSRATRTAPSPGSARCTARSARALYNAGPNLTQKSAIKAFEALPYTRQHRGQGVTGAARRRRSSTTRRRRSQYTQVLIKPEYPCAHPSLPPDPGQLPDLPRPAAGVRQGRQGRERAVLRRQELAALTAEEHRAGEVVARRELAAWGRRSGCVPSR